MMVEFIHPPDPFSRHFPANIQLFFAIIPYPALIPLLSRYFLAFLSFLPIFIQYLS
jgi:hypothetical protein